MKMVENVTRTVSPGPEAYVRTYSGTVTVSEYVDGNHSEFVLRLSDEQYLKLVNDMANVLGFVLRPDGYDDDLPE